MTHRPEKTPEHREGNTVTLAEHETALENVAWRAIRIYEETLKDAAANYPDQIESADGETWSIAMDKRAHAIAHYAREFGIEFTDVRCTRRYMCIDTDPISERAAELACEDPDDVGKHPIAYTWEDDGYMWCDCEAKTPGAVAFWKCEQKPREDR